MIALAVLSACLIRQCTWQLDIWAAGFLVSVIFCGFEIRQHFINEFVNELKSSSSMPSDFTCFQQKLQWRWGGGEVRRIF